MANQERMAEALQQHRPHLLAWLKTQVGDDAPDVLHDVVVRALDRLDSLEPVRDLTAWLWRAVRNRVIDTWRMRSRAALATDPQTLEDVVDDVWTGAQEELEAQELLEALGESIARLPDDLREVIVSQALGGETFASLSARTGVPIETWSTRKRVALARLRRDLEDVF